MFCIIFGSGKTLKKLLMAVTENAFYARILDLVFAKTSPKRSFSMVETERFELVFAGTGLLKKRGGIWFGANEWNVAIIKKVPSSMSSLSKL